jgi:hypothetical protein
MYHRNKVNTDEFWRHELTKNRRSNLDDKANEDLWRQQIAKHSGETSTPAPQHRSIKPEPGGQVEDEQQLQQWLEPAVTAAAGQMSTEMKLLALQSLQNSLTMMSRRSGIVIPSPSSDSNNNNDSSRNSDMVNLQQLAIVSNNNNNNNNGSSFCYNLQQLTTAGEAGLAVKKELQQPESYLALLAQLARESETKHNSSNHAQNRSSRNSNNSEWGRGGGLAPVSGSGQELPEERRGGATPMLPTKEESAVKRTQLWLQQVNRYRSSRLPREELDSANHEQMWEQQIARVKRNPVKSPLEPVEIVLDDGEAETTAATVHPPQPSPRHRIQRHLLQQQQQQQHLRQVTPLCSFKINNNNNISLNNNSNNINNNNNNTINNNNTNISVHSGNNNSRAAYNNHHDFEGNNNNNAENNSLAVFQAKYLPIARSRMSTASASYVLSSEGSFRQEDISNSDLPSSAWPSPVLPRPPSRRDSSPSFIRGSQSAGGSGVEQREGLRRGGEDALAAASDWPQPPSEDNKSMLKSLLLDRMKRKLSSGPSAANQEDGGGGGKKAAYSPSPLQPPPSPVQAAAAARLVSPVPETLPASGPQDILRKRLLGWVDPPPAPITPQSDPATQQSRSRSQQQSATATTNTVQQVAAAVQQEGGDPRSGGEMGWSDLPCSQPTRHLSHLENKMAPLDHHVDKSGDSNLNHLETGSKISVSYTHTSVLKHLLYRYTSMGQ